MPSAVPMFVSIAADQLAAIAVKSLAVAGGFLAGYSIGGIGAWALDRWVLVQKSPEFLKKMIRMVMGVAVAIVVALIVFGDGSGGGLFGGGGSPDSSGTGPSQNVDSEKKTDPSTPIPPEVKIQPRIESPKPPEIRPNDPQVRVLFLGGDAVQGDRFYRLDDGEFLSFDELKSAVLKKKAANTRPLLLIVQFPNDPRQRIDENSINVTQVTNWAKNVAGLEVVWPGMR